MYKIDGLLMLTCKIDNTYIIAKIYYFLIA